MSTAICRDKPSPRAPPKNPHNAPGHRVDPWHYGQSLCRTAQPVKKWDMMKRKFLWDRHSLPALPTPPLAEVGVLLPAHELPALPAPVAAAGKQGCLYGWGHDTPGMGRSLPQLHTGTVGTGTGILPSGQGMAKESAGSRHGVVLQTPSRLPPPRLACGDSHFSAATFL